MALPYVHPLSPNGLFLLPFAPNSKMPLGRNLFGLTLFAIRVNPNTNQG